MSRDFFQKPQAGVTPTCGTVITDIQLSLNAAGSNLEIDGIYGAQSTDALLSYQGARNLTVNGNVSDETWKALIRTPEPPIFERCLQVVASFEGTGFTLVVGNFDGAGITWGIIGFTLLDGELGIILDQINTNYPHLIGQAFGHDADFVIHITGKNASDNEKTEWANSISRGSARYNVADPWKTYFHDLGSFREVQHIQIDRAREVYWAIATQDAASLNLNQELDYLLMYDVAVQNGGMSLKDRLKSSQTAIRRQNPTTATETRTIIANVVADTASAKYRQDVLNRKTTIALGKGQVHGASYDLARWGLLDGQVPLTT